MNNPFENAMKQLDKAAKVVELDNDVLELLKDQMLYKGGLKKKKGLTDYRS